MKKMFRQRNSSLFALIFSALLVSGFAVAYGAEVDIDMGDTPAYEQQKMHQWISGGIKAVELSLGKLPGRNIEVELVTKPYAKEPVPFAQVIRGKTNKVKLQVSSAWPLQDFIDDWTLYHELSHLYIPYLDYPSFWLNEGFATYMQNVVMLKSKVIDEAAFIQKLQAGLERGRLNTISRPGKLSTVSNDMWRKRAYMRVYWSGAAFFMEMDTALLQQGNSLAAVIRQYGTCCLVADSSGQAFMKELDTIAKTTLFSTTYLRYSGRLDFPKLKAEQLAAIAQHYSEDP